MRSTDEQPIVFNSIAELMRHLGQPRPQHPLAALVKSGSIPVPADDIGKLYVLNFYKISFKQDFSGQVRYGQGYYDFEDGGLAFIGPRQIVAAHNKDKEYEGYTLFFHADLIRNYALGKTIGKYGFFSYAVGEALYLSDKEKNIIAALFNAMMQELENNIDLFSQDVVVSQIELLLNYSNRFYNRQFITRKAVYNDLVDALNTWLSGRFDHEHSLLAGLPTVQEAADYLKVSPRYLTDMLKSLTGQSTQQHIHDKLIEKAKDILSTSSLTIAEIAYQLGFEHPQSFTKLFKQKTNASPIEYRDSFKN